MSNYFLIYVRQLREKTSETCFVFSRFLNRENFFIDVKFVWLLLQCYPRLGIHGMVLVSRTSKTRYYASPPTISHIRRHVTGLVFQSGEIIRQQQQHNKLWKANKISQSQMLFPFCSSRVISVATVSLFIIPFFAGCSIRSPIFRWCFP